MASLSHPSAVLTTITPVTLPNQSITAFSEVIDSPEDLKKMIDESGGLLQG